MLETFEKQTVFPMTTEKTGEAVVDASGANVAIVSDLPTGHASRLDIILRQTATGAGNGVQAVTLRTWTSGKRFSHSVQIHAAFTAATNAITIAVPYNAASSEYSIGNSVDILVTNGTQSNTVTAYVIARA